MEQKYQSQVQPNAQSQFQYLVGVDGGGTGTRVLLANHHGVEIGRGCAGPSGLMHGAVPAWKSILIAIEVAFADAKVEMPALETIAIACGLAGVNNAQWAKEFEGANPGFGGLVSETDAGTTLLGAHQGKAGIIIALGTGSVGEVMYADGSRREVGGWGFPSSDEASGAWMGLRAINHVQHVLDGRSQDDAFSQALISFCGGGRDAVFTWLADATQTRFAQLAPLVIEHAPCNPTAQKIMLDAGIEVAKMANALDESKVMPIALCGGLAEAMLPYLPNDLRVRVIKPFGDSVDGALILVKSKFLNKTLSQPVSQSLSQPRNQYRSKSL